MAQILLVGDDIDVRDLAQARLCAAGHSVTAVAGVPAALRAAQRLGRVDLAVLDVDPRGQLTLSVLDQLRVERPDMPALLLTRLRTLGGRAADSGALWLRKPLRSEELAAAVEAALAGGSPATTTVAAGTTTSATTAGDAPPRVATPGGPSGAELDQALRRDRTTLDLRRELAAMRVRRRHGDEVDAPLRGDPS